jgi:hypothetical protein
MHVFEMGPAMVSFNSRAPGAVLDTQRRHLISRGMTVYFSIFRCELHPGSSTARSPALGRCAF